MSPEDVGLTRGALGDDPGPKVTTSEGEECAFCGVTGTVIFAYDAKVYAGGACPDCVAKGVVSDEFGPEHRVMAPMMFIAQALRGVEPFATMKASADAQRLAANRKAKKRTSKQERSRKNERKAKSKARRKNR